MPSTYISNPLRWIGFWKTYFGLQQQPTAVEQAYQEGYDAYNRGLHEEDCSHQAAVLRASWSDGFLDAIGDRHW